jgi:hypothetical protein
MERDEEAEDVEDTRAQPGREAKSGRGEDMPSRLWRTERSSRVGEYTSASASMIVRVL